MAICDVVVVEPVEAPLVGRDLELEITFPDDCNPEEGTLYYRPTAATNFLSTPLVLTASPVTAFIPSAGVSARGIDYYLSLVVNGTPLTVPAANPATNPIRLRVRVDHVEANVSLSPLQYRMISVPFELNDGLVSELEDDFGSYDPEEWRFFRWNAARLRYDEYPNIEAEFEPGTGAWLGTRSGTGFDIEGGRSAMPAPPYPITLYPGWNQIGTPFLFPVAWADIGGINQVQPPVGYNGTEYQYDQPVLYPWHGYFVFNPTIANITLTVPPIEADASVISKSADALPFSVSSTFAVQLQASLPGYDLIDTQNFVGVAENEALEIAEAPGVGEYLRFSVMDGQKRLAASFVPGPDEGHEWDLEAEVVVPGKVLPVRKTVRVKLTEHGLRPPGSEIYVLDLDEGRMLPMVEEQFELSITPPEPVRHLRIIIGTQAHAETQSQGITLTAFENSLLPNYPNPFKASTHIRYLLRGTSIVRLIVYDMLGRQVQVLVHGEQQTGIHEVSWDGRDASGAPVASGTYYYRLEANNGFKMVKRMVLSR